MQPRKIISWIILFSLTIGLFGASPAALAAKKKKQKLLTVTSTAFKNGGEMPVKYGMILDIPGGQNISPPLKWKVAKRIKKKVKSFAIITVDIHPIAKKFVHLLVVDIPPQATQADEGFLSEQGEAPPAVMLKNDFGEIGWGGPSPPQGTGRHVYETTVYALNVASLGLTADKNLTWGQFRKLLKGKTVAAGKIKAKFGYPESTEDEASQTETNTPDITVNPVSTTVEISAAGFSPANLTIPAGAEVTFANKDSELHWPASAVHPTHTSYPVTGGCIGSKFDACKGLALNEAFKFTFAEKGTWNYHDHLNSGMTGTVTVE